MHHRHPRHPDKRREMGLILNGKIPESFGH
jgi:hypothetical protein